VQGKTWYNIFDSTVNGALEKKNITGALMEGAVN